MSTREPKTTPVERLYPHTEILPELTDEALANERGFYLNEVRLTLLSLPAEWRQTALAEQYARCTRQHFDTQGNAGMTEMVDRPGGSLADVAAEILARVTP